MFELFGKSDQLALGTAVDHDPRYRRISDSTFRLLPVSPFGYIVKTCSVKNVARKVEMTERA